MNTLGGDDPAHDLQPSEKDRLERKLRKDARDLLSARKDTRKPIARTIKQTKSLGANRDVHIRKRTNCGKEDVLEINC
jgi:hypothetical protein